MLVLFMLLDWGRAKGTLKFIFGRLIGLKLFLDGQDVIRYDDLSYALGDRVSRIPISRRSLLIIGDRWSFQIGLHNVIGNIWCVLTDSDGPSFTIQEKVLVHLRLGVLLGKMLDVTLPALLLDVIHRHAFDE
jgi:hypothetical protein